MSRVFLCVCVLLAGCQPADGAVVSELSAPSVSSDLPDRERVRFDVQFASEMAQAPLAAARSAPLGAGHAAAARLSVTCPFARGSWQVARALQLEVERIDPADLDPAILDDWSALRRGLAAHVETLAVLKIDLDVPGFGDHLFGYLPEGALMTATDLERSAHPIRDSMPLLGAIDEIVTSYPPDVQDDLADDYAAVAAVLGEEATLSLLLGAWREALARMGERSHSPAVDAWITETVSVLEILRSKGC